MFQTPKTLTNPTITGTTDDCFSLFATPRTKSDVKDMAKSSENVPLVDTLEQFSTNANIGTLLTVEEVAALLQVPISWVYDRTRKRSIDRIPGFRLGKYWRFRKADILRWIERQRVGGNPDA